MSNDEIRGGRPPRTSGDGTRRPAGTQRPAGSRPAAGTTGQRRPVQSSRPTTSRPATSRTTTSETRTRSSQASRPSQAGRNTSSSRQTSSSRRPAERPSSRPVNSGNRRNPNEIADSIRANELRQLQKERKKRQQTIKNIILIVVMVLVVAAITIGLVLLSGKLFSGNKDSGKKGILGSKDPKPSITSVDQAKEPDATNTPTPTPTIEVKTVKLIAVGDDLIHTGVMRKGNNSGDYSYIFSGVKDYIQDADIRAINQETIFGGDDKEFCSYPLFNSPSKIGDAAVDAGFNLFTHATNHALDMGEPGLKNCVEYWRTNHPDIMMVGIFDNEEDEKKIPIMEVNGIKFAILNYTYSHNAENWYGKGVLKMLCAFDDGSRIIDFNTINQTVIDEIKQAEELADFTIVFPHWGVEYTMTPTEQEKNFAMQMTEAGADLIIGTHPHVIQPVEWVTSENNNKALCYYSLGNFTSTQDAFERILGGMASLTIVSDENGIYIDEESIKAIPLVTQYTAPGWDVTSTYLLRDYTADMASSHGLLSRVGQSVTVDKLTDLAKNTFGDYYAIE